MSKFDMEDDGYFPPGTEHEDEFFSMSGLNFVWDKPKSERNLRIKGYSFKTAALVFNDRYCLYQEDVTHSVGEQRDWVMGFPVSDLNIQELNLSEKEMEFMNDLIFVVFTERLSRDGKDLIRIISSRLATKDEIDDYYKNRNDIKGL